MVLSGLIRNVCWFYVVGGFIAVWVCCCTWFGVCFALWVGVLTCWILFCLLVL